VESPAKSIAREGLLHPIVVRPHPSEEGKWEIRAGERQWRAASFTAVVWRLDESMLATNHCDPSHGYMTHGRAISRFAGGIDSRNFSPKSLSQSTRTRGG